MSSEEQSYSSGGNGAESHSVSGETQTTPSSAFAGGGAGGNPPECHPLPLTAARELL